MKLSPINNLNKQPKKAAIKANLIVHVNPILTQTGYTKRELNTLPTKNTEELKITLYLLT